jgi:hypothetical protein
MSNGALTKGLTMKKTALALVTVVILASCGGSDDNASDATDAPAGTDAPAATDAPEQTSAPSSTEATNEGADDGVLAVPDEFATIQEAVDAASPGDLVLISPGVYNEAVNVTTDELTIRGLDRNEVILDGQFELDNGVRVLGASGVAVENLTAQNYTNNGVFWTSVDGYRGSYLTAYRNGDYGIYAFDSVNGLLEHSYASGSPDAGFYIGQCYECNAVMDDVIAEYNGLGYSGTTSGGNLYIINSRFNNNRAGINMNSATYELCYPQRRATIVGNTVYDNNQTDTPAIDDAILAQNNGILVEGGIGNVIERNLVFDQGKVGIGLVPFPEFEPNDAEPSEDTWDLPCSETRDLPLADPDTLEAILWSPKQNSVVGNVVENSGVADLAISAVDGSLAPIDPTTLGNCFAGNVFTSSAPTDIEALLPCEGAGSGADFLLGDLNVVSWLTDAENAPPSVDYDKAPTPTPPLLDGMPDAATAPARPATNMPPTVDIAAIAVPTRP